MNNKILCIYHARCLDGFAAAYALGLSFGFSNVDFHASDYDDPVPDIKGRIVYLVDFSYKPEVLRPLIRDAMRVTILDHHKTAMEDWALVEEDNLFKHFVKGQSGAVICWEFFQNLQVPELFLYFQDYDLWQFEYKHTREIVAAIDARGFVRERDFVALTQLLVDPKSIVELIVEGTTILRANRAFVHGLLQRNTTMIRFMGYDVPLANVPHEFRDLAGEMLYREGFPFAVTYDDWLSKGIRSFSLRSPRIDGVDVGGLTRRMGGGGHANAAGFKVSLNRDLSTYIQFLKPLS